MNNVEKYLNILNSNLSDISKNKNIIKASEEIAKAYSNGNKTYIFGTGHSHIIGEETFARAGGWNYFIPILENEITLTNHPFKSTYIERTVDYANVLMELYPINKGDVIIIVSNSGRNNLIIELALLAKKKRAKVIAISSISHSQSIKSRHKSNKKLVDIAHIVIDNKAPSGDATVNVNKQKIAPVSTINGIFVIHCITITTLEILSKNKVPFDIYVSSNLDNQDKRNKEITK